MISQIIIGNILKNSDNINENLEIKLSRNYQVLSKKTSLFAVVEGEQENKIAEFKQIKKREKPQNISHINNIYNEYNGIMYAPKKKKRRLANYQMAKTSSPMEMSMRMEEEESECKAKPRKRKNMEKAKK